ncbi:unnamed protein product [Brachionus calyciflorus]|uniref:Uncharacterized protein n=1 Tax=Brachionus calyciflorus TaxID=104777 RepID=A0A813MLQ1_9BILA|nr:unnamed protein product [Brachionus calyciflorus]
MSRKNYKDNSISNKSVISNQTSDRFYRKFSQIHLIHIEVENREVIIILALNLDKIQILQETLDYFQDNLKIANSEKIPLQKETIDFKFEFYKKLRNLYYDFNFNITNSEFESLKYFIKNKLFKILECDKNVGISLISNSNYDKLALDHLNDGQYYLKLEKDPLIELTNSINSILRELCFRKNISK